MILFSSERKEKATIRRSKNKYLIKINWKTLKSLNTMLKWCNIASRKENPRRKQGLNQELNQEPSLLVAEEKAYRWKLKELTSKRNMTHQFSVRLSSKIHHTTKICNLLTFKKTQGTIAHLTIKERKKCQRSVLHHRVPVIRQSQRCYHKMIDFQRKKIIKINNNYNKKQEIVCWRKRIAV